MSAGMAATIVHSLKFQKRLAMELLEVGQRHVWLNPEKKHEIAKARSRMTHFSGLQLTRVRCGSQRTHRHQCHTA